MKFKTWTIVLTLAIIVALGFLIPTLLNDKAASVSIDYEQKKQETIEDFKATLAATITATDLEVQKRITEEKNADKDAKEPSKTEENNTATEVKEVADSNKKEAAESTDNKEAVTSVVVDNAGEADADAENDDQTYVVIEDDEVALSESGVYVKDAWVNEKIQENRDDIEEVDLDRGVTIYNSLDTYYLFSLADEGLTDEEKVLVDEYLSSELSGTDYDIAKELYYKYVGLLNK